MTETDTPKKRPGVYHIYKGGMLTSTSADPLAGFEYVTTVEGSKADAEKAASEAAGGQPCTIKVLQDRGTATVEMRPAITW